MTPLLTACIFSVLFQELFNLACVCPDVVKYWASTLESSNSELSFWVTGQESGGYVGQATWVVAVSCQYDAQTQAIFSFVKFWQRHI